MRFSFVFDNLPTYKESNQKAYWPHAGDDGVAQLKEQFVLEYLYRPIWLHAPFKIKLKKIFTKYCAEYFNFDVKVFSFFIN